MKANDGDKDRQHNIVYFLTGQGVDPDQPDQSMFDINRTTGEIFVLKVNLIFIHNGEGFVLKHICVKEPAKEWALGCV